MYLKRLELYGFKTFAERTELTFGPGVTAIVGPNGSGKSNLCDAILWVLGEQSMKALRSHRAQEVIFAGSDGRRPVGLAEVSLTLDNADGGLPVEYVEVMVTRRVYRSGEGEYLINKVPVRLRDLQELFLDTGMGKEAYSVINQNQVDAALSARPEDRRALIEEAAGIQKYRHRKREALHKLEATRGHLARVSDIIAELEGQVGPLAEQSEQARCYRGLVGEQRELGLALVLLRRHQLAENLARNAEREQELGDQLTAIRTRSAALAAQEEALRQELAQAEERLEAARTAAGALGAEAEKASGRAALVRQSLGHLDSEQQAADRDIAALKQQQAALGGELARMQAAAAELSEEEAALATQVREQQAALAAAEEQLRASAGDSDELRSVYLRLVDGLTGKRNALAQCDSILRSAQARQERLAAQRSSLDQAAQAAAAERAQLAGALAGREADRGTVLADTEQAQADLEAARAQLARQVQEVAALAQDHSARQSRLAALQELEEAKEGYYPGVRAVLAAAGQGELPGAYHAVADLVRVPARYQQAVEVALGGAVQDIVTEQEEEAKAAIAYLKRTRAGRATFLPLPRIRPAPRLPDHPPQGDCLGVAVDLVSFDERYRPVFDHLLGRVLVSPDLEAALRLGRREKGWRLVVTLEGEVIHPYGAMTGGSARPSQLLGRKREIADLARVVGTLAADLARAQAQQTAAEHRVAQAQAEGEKLAEAAAELERLLVRHQADLEAVEAEGARVAAELEAVQAEAAGLQADCQAADTERTALQAAIGGLEGEQRALEAAMGRNEASLKAEQAQRDELAAALLEVQTRHASVAARVNAAHVAAKRESERLAAVGDQLVARRQAVADIARRREQMLAELAAQGGETERMAGELAAAEQALEAARQQRQQALDRVAACLEAQGINRTEAEDAQGRLHRLELRSTQVRTELDLLHEQLAHDHQLTPEQAEAAYRPIERVEDYKARLAELDAAVAEMGEVNLGAVEEYERVSGRLDFLAGQREDLERAQADLEQVIAEIDRASSARFQEVFAAVAEHFQGLFTRLFQGGDTSLTLTDPADPLESGVEVHVTIPGKRPQHLLLLSGGERALTALAFLFALLRVRPSPFVVLDEIDAPLDEANVSRFTELLADFVTASQFLVITHNKGTIEAADTIYGVTMEKPGVSRVVSLHLADLEAQPGPVPPPG